MSQKKKVTAEEPEIKQSKRFSIYNVNKNLFLGLTETWLGDNRILIF